MFSWVSDVEMSHETLTVFHYIWFLAGGFFLLPTLHFNVNFTCNLNANILLYTQKL